MRNDEHDLTDQQMVAASFIAVSEVSGKVLREKLTEAGFRKDGPRFYVFMGRLERDGLVDGRYVKVQGNTRQLRERHYKLTATGRRALDRKIALMELAKNQMQLGFGYA